MNAALLKAPHGATIRIPRRAFMLRDDGEVHLASDAATKAKSFSMVALTGKPLQHFWFGTLSIDLSGVAFKQRLPALLDHDTNQRVGYTTSIQHDAKRGLVAEGKLLQRSEAAQTIMADGEDGFPWQASTYLQASVVERLSEGQVATVNGQQLTGPAAIFRQSTLREVTFTALGVDDDTSATPLADTDAGEEVAVHLMTNETEDTDMSKTTNADTGEANKAAAPVAPAITETQLKDAADKARADERARVTLIRASASATQHELVDKLVADGTPIEKALLAINEDLRARLATGNKAPEVAPLGAGNKSDVAKTAADTGNGKAATLSGKDLWQKEWNDSAELKAEFDSPEVYFAFRGNEDKCKDFSSATEFAKAQGPNHNDK